MTLRLGRPRATGNGAKRSSGSGSGGGASPPLRHSSVGRGARRFVTGCRYFRESRFAAIVAASVRGVRCAAWCMVVKAWVRRMSSGGGGGDPPDEGSGRRWPVGILRRSGARAARRVLHVKYRSVPPTPSPAPTPVPPVLPLDIDDTVSLDSSRSSARPRAADLRARSRLSHLSPVITTPE
ncbi:hypothetical protein K1T71_005341 [Dendrolimus kikuchii]|uniref:Uncharacterized protein n=1 Tax=Dendrolimus kikuchii TaxID=765133 RepID=A0ACC1D6P5_9NEOP|nr:hypothetical protein K1T71_005341 [Dendrolimus kikuchii]